MNKFKTFKRLYCLIIKPGSKIYRFLYSLINRIRILFGTNSKVYRKFVKNLSSSSDYRSQISLIKNKLFEESNKFSVIMPVYNPLITLLGEAIQSVRNQTYPNWELCIADDASTSQGVRDLILLYLIFLLPTLLHL